MTIFSKILCALVLALSSFAATAFASAPDIYVVNFRNEKTPESRALDQQLFPALSMAGVNSEQVFIDITTPARWEKGAHEAFDRGLVPLFNKWVGLTGFAAIVDAKTKRVLGCVNQNFSAIEIAREIQGMSATVTRSSFISGASYSGKSTLCPPPFNTPPT